MQVHHTKGVVLRAVKYGETSLIVSIYTELFGIQQYIIKGVRTASKKAAANASYFQPGALLDLQAYHQDIKSIQYIKEYQWAYLYRTVFSSVIKNSVLLYIVELLQHCSRQPESNNDIFYLTEEVLQLLDTEDDTFTANLPIYYSVKLAARLGFEIQDHYTPETPVLDYKEGYFVHETPAHNYYMPAALAEPLSNLILSPVYNIGTIALNRTQRNSIMEHLQLFFQLHIPYYGKLNSPDILKQILAG